MKIFTLNRFNFEQRDFKINYSFNHFKLSKQKIFYFLKSPLHFFHIISFKHRLILSLINRKILNQKFKSLKISKKKLMGNENLKVKFLQHKLNWLNI